MKPLVSVITLTHNKLDVTKKCLLSWLQTAYSPWELIVVDNGSTDGTPEWLKTFARKAEVAGIKAQVVLNRRNIGCSTARNQGMQKAEGSRIVFMDNDVALRSRNWMTALSLCLNREMDVALIGPKLVYPFPPYAIQCAGVGISPSGRVQFRGRGESRDDLRFARREKVQCLISACCMVRTFVLADVGGFDEAFNPVQFEDFDLCYRIRSKGYKAIYEPSVEMYHFESTTTAGTPSLPNTGVIVRHGLLFKKRWKHMFKRENGPDDDETRWRTIPPTPVETIGKLPVL